MEEFEILLEAAIQGKAELVRLDEVKPEVLSGTTEKGNTFLHIASLCGHKDFCSNILKQGSRVHSVSSLLSVANNYGETPLLIAVKGGHDKLASYLLGEYSTDELDLLKQDMHGCNVLHHAIRNGYDELALQLIRKQPALSESCSYNHQESPMFMAVLKGFKEVYAEMLCNERSKYTGPGGYNVLHAAVKYGNTDFVKKLVDKRPESVKRLAEEKDSKNDTPMHLAAHYNRDEILKEMLNFDRSLGYINSEENGPLLYSAAHRGHVNFAQALLEHCPDALYCNNKGRTCLHKAVEEDQMKFVEFILKENSKLGKLVNVQDGNGDSALHLAVEKCNPKMVSALLGHRNIDITVIDRSACTAIWKLNEFKHLSKTTNWNKIFLDIYDADPLANTDIYNLHEQVRNQIIISSRKDAKSPIQTYKGDISLVAILIATITFAAAFTLPGGYSSQVGSEGLPILARKLAFQAFLIFDTLAMCSSLSVAFMCVIERWKAFEFLLQYRFFTKKLMWFAYMATTLAFGTGLYTVLAGRLHWLAIAICVLSALLPILTMMIGEWPILNLKNRYRKTPFNSDFLDLV